jgi:lipopolysaccharide/colanic/teichoic acid biosynthesis glycosyltransferase
MRSGAQELQSELSTFNEVQGPIFKMRDDPRCTWLGRRIRRWSLDELPQIWNVLLGSMSLVGPRPPLPEEVARYDDHHRRRLEVKPGMTGIWQVSGRSHLPFDEMVLMDVYYVDNWSLSLDLKILVRTVVAVLTRHGAY